MIKKLVVGTLALGVVGGFLFGRDFFSYVRTAGSNVRNAVRSEITPEFELDRIRGQVENLMPEIRGHMAVVAEQSVDIKDMEQDLARREESLADQKAAILALRSDLDTGRDSFTYRHVSYSRREVEADLADRFDSYCTSEETVKRDRQILAAQRETLNANRRKLDRMLGQKHELAVKLAQVEARLKQIQAAEAVHSIEVDDTRLSQVDEMLKKLNHQLDVREALLEAEGSLTGRIPVDHEPTSNDDDVVSRIDRHFGDGPADAERAETPADVTSL